MTSDPDAHNRLFVVLSGNYSPGPESPGMVLGSPGRAKLWAYPVIPNWVPSLEPPSTSMEPDPSYFVCLPRSHEPSADHRVALQLICLGGGKGGTSNCLWDRQGCLDKETGVSVIGLVFGRECGS